MRRRLTKQARFSLKTSKWQKKEKINRARIATTDNHLIIEKSSGVKLTPSLPGHEKAAFYAEYFIRLP